MVTLVWIVRSDLRSLFVMVHWYAVCAERSGAAVQERSWDKILALVDCIISVADSSKFRTNEDRCRLLEHVVLRLRCVSALRGKFY